MLPVPDYQFAKDAEERVFAAGACLCGYFLFVESNHPVNKYMKDEGLIEMDYMLADQHTLHTGASKVGIFAFEPIDEKWIRHAHGRNNLWWRIFGPTPAPVVEALLPAPSGSPTDLKQAMNMLPKDVIVQVEVGERVTLQELPKGDWVRWNRKNYNHAVALEVVGHLGLDRSELPLVLFFTRKRGKYWRWSLSEMRTEQGVIAYFSALLKNPGFLDILNGAEKERSGAS